MSFSFISETHLLIFIFGVFGRCKQNARPIFFEGLVASPVPERPGNHRAELRVEVAEKCPDSWYTAIFPMNPSEFHTVFYGWNPVNSPVGSLSHYFLIKVLYIPGGSPDVRTINSRDPVFAGLIDKKKPVDKTANHQTPNWSQLRCFKNTKIAAASFGAREFWGSPMRLSLDLWWARDLR